MSDLNIAQMPPVLLKKIKISQVLIIENENFHKILGGAEGASTYFGNLTFDLI